MAGNERCRGEQFHALMKDMRTRFLEACLHEGEMDAYLDVMSAYNDFSLMARMHVWLMRFVPAGWTWQSSLEVAALGMEHVVELPRPLPEPTTATPGSQAKREVIAERAALGLELWHPADADCTGRPANRQEVIR